VEKRQLNESRTDFTHALPAEKGNALVIALQNSARHITYFPCFL